MSSDEVRFAAQWRTMSDDAEALTELLQRTYERLVEQDQVGRFVMHRYLCKRGCKIAEVFRYGGRNLCAVRDYKLSPGMNRAQSVPEARQRNTLDGARHWPGRVYDLDEIASFGAGVGVQMVCRHVNVRVVEATAALNDIVGVTPGKPRKPTRLGDAIPPK